MKQRKSKINFPSKYVLAILSVICVMLLFFSYATNFSGGPLNTIASYTFIPMQKGVNFIGSSISINSTDIKSKQDIIAENEMLKSQVEELNSKLSKQEQQLSELSTLLELYNMDKAYDYEMTGARIIARGSSNWFSSFTIDKGEDDGIAVDMNVISDGGLVGIVTSVGKKYSVVRAIIDDTSNVSSTITSSDDYCIVSGSISSMTDKNVISFSDLDDSEGKVAIGDSVVTSVVSDKYVPGILIGYVASVEADDNGLTKSGTIVPVVDFRHLKDVLVILDLKETYN